MVLHKTNVAVSIINYISQGCNATVFPIKQFKEASSKNVVEPRSGVFKK